MSARQVRWARGDGERAEILSTIPVVASIQAQSPSSGSPLVLSRVHWVRPELVVEVKYLAWTGDNLLRQVVYEGLREDKSAGEVRDAACEVIDVSGDVLPCAENLSVLIASAGDSLQYAVHIAPSESLTQKPRCPG